MLLETRIALSLIVLGVSSYFDLKKREVEDKLWLPFAFTGVGLIAYETLLNPSYQTLTFVGASLAISAALGYAIYRTGLFGGADAKALFTVTLLLPMFSPPIGIHPFTPISLLSNTVYSSLVLPFIFASWNIYRLLKGTKIFSGFTSEPSWRRAAAIFLGVRVKSETGSRFMLILEKTVDGKRQFDFSLSKNFETFAQGEDIWVTPGIPFLLFMLAGFIILLVFGDLNVTLLLAILNSLTAP